MTRGTLRGRWRREVFTSSRISDSVRVLLLAMADDMTEAGRVSIPRAQLAARIGRTERRVAERIEQAVDAGLLSRVARGKPGTTAVYAALLSGQGKRARPRSTTASWDDIGGGGRPPVTPIPLGGRTAAPIKGRTGAPSPPDQKGADGGPARGNHPPNPDREAQPDTHTSSEDEGHGPRRRTA